MPFPEERPRRLRRTAVLRRLVCETKVSVDDLIQPLFIVEGSGIKKEIASLPGQFHLSPDKAAEECKRIFDLGVPGVIIFGIPNHKDPVGSGASSRDGIIQTAVRRIKEAAPELLVITDVCLCEYTDHGHCGIIRDNDVDNDATLFLLANAARSLGKAGADIVAPSDMMDGRVAAIRKALDEVKLSHIPILSYAAKFASAFYGPFRDAAGSAPSFGDRRGYQMDPANFLEAVREVELDIDESADMVMVKPAMPYLDVLYAVKSRFGKPTGAYQVSGEYAMIEAAAGKGWLDRKRAICESMLSIKRAGADFILTYWASEAAEWINEGSFNW